MRGVEPRVDSEPPTADRHGDVRRRRHRCGRVGDHRCRTAWRLEVFADAYGLTSTVGLVDDVIARQRLTIVHVEELGERGLAPQVRWIRDGLLDESRRLLSWAEANRGLFT